MERTKSYDNAELDHLADDYIKTFEPDRFIRILEARLYRSKHELGDSLSRGDFWLMAAISSAAFNIALVIVLFFHSHGH